MTAYIGHALSNYDNKAGDSSGKEVKISEFIYSSSKKSVYNWTYVFRPKKNARFVAKDCEGACRNNNIGYCSTGTKTYGKNAIQNLAPKVGYDLSKIKTKTGCSCGDLVSLCSRYAKLTTFYKGSALAVSKALKSSGNYKTLKYSRGMTLKRGDVLVTAHSNGKYNHVVVYLGKHYAKKLPTIPARGYFAKGDKGANVKLLQIFLNWAIEDPSVPKLKPDGVCGNITYAHVAIYQKENALKADSKFGQKSLAKGRVILR